jgi:uncharacterized protein (TIGR03067 family)
MNRIALFTLGFALHYAIAASAADKPQVMPKELRGIWVFDHVLVGGELLDHRGELTGTTLEIVDGKWIETYTRSDGTKSMRTQRVELVPTMSPKQMTIFEKRVLGSIWSPVEAEEAMPAIYVVKGNTLTICIGDERPTEFNSRNARLVAFKKQPDLNATQPCSVTRLPRPRLLLPHLGHRFRR